TGSHLMHPHVARVFEFHDDEVPWYGQQYIGGPDIGGVTGQSPDQALRPFVFIADALRYAHAKGIVHRDIKAANVLLDRRGLPYLIDFGVAAVEGEEASGGTPIAAGRDPRPARPASPAEDVYALGVLMHEVLAGRPPQPGAAGAVPAVEGLALEPRLRGLLADMLAADERERPAAGEVVRRLEEAGVAAGPASIPGHAGDLPEDAEIVAEQAFARRPRGTGPQAAEGAAAARGGGIPARLAFGGLAVLLVLVVSVVFLLPRLVEKRAAVPAEEPPAVADTAPDAQPAVADPGEAEDTASEAELRARADEALGAMLSRLERLRA